MQGVDCRNYKELLDSYLCEELAVETNHAMLHHAEHCPPCRGELAARRELRQTLRRACSREVMSEEAIECLRARLRAEAKPKSKFRPDAIWPEWFARIFAPQAALPVAITTALLLLFGGLWAFYWYRSGMELKKGEVGTSELSSVLMDEAASDHLTCARNFASASGPAKMPDSVRNFDPAYAGLEAAAEDGAAHAGGLQLRSAHICNHQGRRFAHLVYTRGSQLISVLVTDRDFKAMGETRPPNDDGSREGVQIAQRSRTALGAYQTNKHIVLVVSELPEAENTVLAEQLGLPVAAHLRRVETEKTGVS